MTDFTKQITAESTAASVAALALGDPAFDEPKNWGNTVAQHKVLTAAIDAYIAARDRGYTPGEMMPPKDGNRFLAELSDRPGHVFPLQWSEQFGCFEDDAGFQFHEKEIGRWWHLPGGKR